MQWYCPGTMQGVLEKAIFSGITLLRGSGPTPNTRTAHPPKLSSQKNEEMIKYPGIKTTKLDFCLDSGDLTTSAYWHTHRYDRWRKTGNMYTRSKRFIAINADFVQYQGLYHNRNEYRHTCISEKRRTKMVKHLVTYKQHLKDRATKG